MIIYKRLKPFKAISFDLDDTLYDNKPVILAAEQAMVDFMAHHYSRCNSMGLSAWLSVKNKVACMQPELKHDVSLWRQATIKQALTELEYSEQESMEGAQRGFEHFLQVRSQVSIPEYSHHLLTRLASNFPIIAITNGNVCLKSIGLAKYFSHHFAAGNGRKMKPAADLFLDAQQALNLPASDILHIGDHLLTDISGAMQHGLQSVWLNLQSTKTPHYQLLPNIEIKQLQELEQLF